jgi:hypothetical protein
MFTKTVIEDGKRLVKLNNGVEGVILEADYDENSKKHFVHTAHVLTSMPATEEMKKNRPHYYTVPETEPPLVAKVLERLK